MPRKFRLERAAEGDLVTRAMDVGRGRATDRVEDYVECKRERERRIVQRPWTAVYY